jgi:hypothetical protein
LIITLEGIQATGKSIPKRQLITTWKTLTTKPFPKIKGYQLKDADFNRIIQLRRCEEDEQRELQEWNTILTTEGTDACVFNSDEKLGCEFVILVREKPYHSLEKILTHELSHIARGDL